MAYQNNNNFRGNGGGFGGNRGYEAPVKNTDPMPLPAAYVDEAEKVINGLTAGSISSTKLRKLFGLFTDLYNEVKRSSEKTMNENQKQVLSTARVRLIYESGRDRNVGTFVEKAKLLNYLKSVGDSNENLISFYNYFEALVAYYRFRFAEKD